jgi:hypothetical protein
MRKRGSAECIGMQFRWHTFESINDKYWCSADITCNIKTKDGRRNETRLKFQEIRCQTQKFEIEGGNKDENVVFLPHITFTSNKSGAFPGLEATSISHHCNDGNYNDCKRKKKSVAGIGIRFSNTKAKKKRIQPLHQIINKKKVHQNDIYEINLRISSLRMDYIE